MRIAITGLGIISAIGNNRQEVLSSLLNKRSGIGEIRYLRTLHQSLPVGEVCLSNEEMKKQLNIDESRELSRTALLGMTAVDEALEDGNIGAGKNGLEDAEAKHRVVLINGTTVGGMDITENHFSEIANGGAADILLQHDCGSCTQLIADHFGIFSEVTTVSTACSSAANAILLGAQLLRTGEADMVIAGGTEALSRFHLHGFHSLMILDEHPCRPFDAGRAGLNLGEGAAYVVMEREEQAMERKATIQAYLAGYANCCDAYHQTASSEDGEGAWLAMRGALDMARIEPEEIDYVNAHGTGTPDNDRSESAALRRVFGTKMPPVSSTKSFTGHTTSASGSIETVISILAMQHHFIPANLNWEHQMADGITPSPGEAHASLRNILCNSFGFGGNDSSLLLTREAPKAELEVIEPAKGKLKILSKVEIKESDELDGIRRYVKPIEARRMGKLMKAGLLSSLQALEEAGIETPDAIVTATAYGCLENSEKLLQQIELDGEVLTKPTYFMQSTHNTISSAIAIKTKCHGYNMTYTQGAASLDRAMHDAEILLRSGQCTTVLVGCHDESAPIFSEAMFKATGKRMGDIHSIAMVVTCGK